MAQHNANHESSVKQLLEAEDFVYRTDSVKPCNTDIGKDKELWVIHADSCFTSNQVEALKQSDWEMIAIHPTHYGVKVRIRLE